MCEYLIGVICYLTDCPYAKLLKDAEFCPKDLWETEGNE